MISTRLLLPGLCLALCAPAALHAQERPHPRAEIPGFDFRPDGVWRKQVRQIRANRARLLAQRRFSTLNAAVMVGAPAPLSPGAPSPASSAVSGVLRVPAILFKYRNTPAGALRSTGQYDRALFATVPPGGRPYTYRMFYEQMSNGLMSIQGKTYGYAALDDKEVVYTGGTSDACLAANPFRVSNCNGIWSGAAVAAMQAGLRRALQRVDAEVDWRDYDGDGDGFVDLVLFIHPTVGGECGPRSNPNNHLWAHRFSLGTPYLTHSFTSNGIRIKVADYILQSGVGGATACDPARIMPIGTVAHETGHGLGLPDLYDTADSSEGIGQWGLMGSGSFTSALSPARMEAWSLSQLGWVTVRPLGAGGVYRFGPAPLSDTAFYARVAGANPRGEYFLFENRQPAQADTAVIRIHCQESGLAATCSGGLLVWHIDSMQIANASFSNRVNSGPIHGVALVQADGLRNLDVNFTSPGSNRGDAGDPYPGAAGNSVFSAVSVPAALRNSDGRPAGVAVDDIQQLGGGLMSFQLVLPVTLVRATDTAATVRVNGSPFTVYRETLDPGTPVDVSVDQIQLTAGGRTRQTFVSWSLNGGAPVPDTAFSFTAGTAPDTVIATLARAHRVGYAAVGTGTVSGSVPDGAFVDQGTPVTLSAAPAGGGPPFAAWAGDTTTTAASITLPMGRPYDVRAVFLASLATTAVVSQLLSGTGLTPQQQADLDQLGNANGRFDVGDFLAWVDATGAPEAAKQQVGGGGRR